MVHLFFVVGSIGGDSSGDSALGKRSAGTAGLGSNVVKKVYVPQKEHPDVNFVGVLIGPKGATLKAMSERTGCKILVKGKGSSKNMDPTAADADEELHVMIEGSEELVSKAIAEVEEILYNPAKLASLKNEQLGSMNINVNSGGGSSSSIYGPGLGSSGVAGISQLGAMQSNSGYSNNFSEGEKMYVPNGVVGLIIGRGGDQLQRLQSASGATCQIQKEYEMAPGETKRMITLKGTPECIASLRVRIQEVVDNALAPKTQSKAMPPLESPFIIKLSIPNDKVGLIIGKAGVTLSCYSA